MIQMPVCQNHRIESAIRSCWRLVERLRFFAALKQTAINENPRLFRLDDVTGTRDFAASRANRGGLHRANELLILDRLEQGCVLDFRLTNYSALDVLCTPRRISSIL
jgi:hypothetical protein